MKYQTLLSLEKKKKKKKKKKKIRSSSATILTRFLKEVNFVLLRSHVKRRLPTFLNMMTMIWRFKSLYLSLNMGSNTDNKCQFSFLFFFFNESLTWYLTRIFSE